MNDVFGSPDLGPIAQVVLGVATLVNSLLLWPVVKKLQHNDERQDRRIDALEPRPRARKKGRK